MKGAAPQRLVLWACLVCAALLACSSRDSQSEGSPPPGDSDPSSDADADGASDEDSDTDPPADEPGPLLELQGDVLHLRLRAHADATPAPSRAHLRSGLYYFRHSLEAYQLYTARTHQTTRGIDLNWALEISECANPTHCASQGRPASSGFRDLLRAPDNPIFHEIVERSEQLVVHFGNMPKWLSSCEAKNPGGAAACDAAWHCNNRRFSTYAPGDWSAWALVVHEAVDVLLDLTEFQGQPRQVYLEAFNEPDASCYWTDTRDSLLELWRQTAIAVSEAKTALCASKGLSTERCARLAFGGGATSAWDGRIRPLGSSEATAEPSLNETLIAYALEQGALDPRVRMDFVSFHGFFHSVGGGPRARLAEARHAYETAYAAHAGSAPPFPMPELLVTEWNASDAERARSRHPVLLAEGFFGLVEQDLRVATIASLDQQATTATLASNDFGLLATNPTTTHPARPAFFVYSAMAALADAATSYAAVAAGSARLIVSNPRVVDDVQCFDAVVWDFVPHPLAEAVLLLFDPARCGQEALAASYASVQSAEPLPAACEAYAAELTNEAARALCVDIARGTCGSIPVPTPAGGHACDATWSSHFAAAGSLFASLRAREAAPLDLVVHDFASSPSAASPVRAVIREDHIEPEPKALGHTLDMTDAAARFDVRRNDVVYFKNLCVR